MLGSSYPVPAFHFLISISPGFDMAFQEVDGLNSKLEIDPISEGGENKFQHRLPKHVSHPNLVLKRAIAGSLSPLVMWCKDTLEGNLDQPLSLKTVLVSLLDENGSPSRVWSVQHAFPVAWTVESFDAMKNAIAIERIELSYTSLNRDF